MKATGRHPDKKLTAMQVRNLRTPGKYPDGGCLYLVVEDSGAKHWLLRTMVQGNRKDIGLGGTGTVSLAEAREQAAAFRKIAREGGDPLAARQAARRVIPNFQDAAKIVHAGLLPSWKNPKHGQQWINTLTTYAFPSLGSKRVDRITTADVLGVLSPIWLEKGETAGRVLQRISTIMDWSKTAGFRTGDNPVDGVKRGLPRQTDTATHFPALPYQEMPTFILRLRSCTSSEVTRLAFEYLILTATRTSEVQQMLWSEVDLASKCWTIPASRMKAGREHRVPLSDRCIEILNHAARFSASGGFVFPGTKVGKPLSNMTFTLILKRMVLPITAHGFRSTFRDWSSEETRFTKEVCEMALAHVIENRTEAAYRRGDLYERRRELMSAWANYACSLPAQPQPDAKSVLNTETPS